MYKKGGFMENKSKFEKIIFLIITLFLSYQILKAAYYYFKLAFLYDGILMKIFFIALALLLSSFVPSAILSLMGSKLKHKNKLGILYRLVVQIITMILLAVLVVSNIFYFFKNPEGKWSVLITAIIFLIVIILVVSKSINDYLAFKNDIEGD